MCYVLQVLFPFSRVPFAGPLRVDGLLGLLLAEAAAARVPPVPSGQPLALLRLRLQRHALRELLRRLGRLRVPPARNLVGAPVEVRWDGHAAYNDLAAVAEVI